MNFSWYKTVVFAIFAIFLQSCDTTKSLPTPVASNLPVNFTLGNPSKAATDITKPTNYLIEVPQYALAYNNTRNIPTWVSWHLDSKSRGSADRTNDFRPYALPSTWHRVSTTDYSNSGFDRGHNCPSADRTASTEDNSNTFYMTNIIPQAPNHNQHTWNDLEGWTRSQLDNGNECYVIMGNYGEGGTGSKGYKTKIGPDNNITVPKSIWKVIVILPEGENDLARITANTRVVSVDIVNANDVDKENWQYYRTSVDAIEKATGLDLLSELPDAIENILEAKVDNQ
jgi:endonuclease G, mitochondrial